MTHRAATDRGDSLIEVLVALAVLGIGITGLLSALASHAATTTVNEQQSQAETTLVSAAEYVKGLAFAGCSPTTWTAISTAAVPRDGAYTVEYGNARQLGSVPCTKLAIVTVRVMGNDFQGLTLDVVKRS